ncbi:NusA-like transcription termination signal-binding factor [Candidatus Woesearchaeota archaeon]|nr:NusA-like transcription termination signal-binding factor [Candidatus Woesearchaeota archaeon]
MTRIKYDIDLMKYMSFFESLTKAKLKDCIPGENSLTFIVEQNEVGKAVGKRGCNVRKIENALKKKIRVVEYNPDVRLFVRNLIYPLKAEDISEEDGIITIKGPDSRTRGLLIGRNASNLRTLESIVKRYFPIQGIKVV